MHPVSHRGLAITRYILCNFTLVVRKEQVQTSSMDIKLQAQILGAHGRALQVPARITIAPFGRPAHDMGRIGLFPQGEVQRTSLFRLSVQASGIG